MHLEVIFLRKTLVISRLNLVKFECKIHSSLIKTTNIEQLVAMAGWTERAMHYASAATRRAHSCPMDE